MGSVTNYESWTQDDFEVFSFARIPHDIREVEANLFPVKWFDYVPLHPLHATFRFADLYEQAVREEYERTKDLHTAASVSVFKGVDVDTKLDIVSFTLARQAMDNIGVRYDFGLRYILKRFSDRGWVVFPRPNQLYQSELLADLADAWRDACSTSFQLPCHPMFKVAHYKATPEQKRARQWLIGQVKSRGKERYWQGLSRLFEEELLDIPSAIPAFGIDNTRKAARVAGIAFPAAAPAEVTHD